jgi:hypothetical protein
MELATVRDEMDDQTSVPLRHGDEVEFAFYLEKTHSTVRTR